jgi:hypothetical protein
VAFNGVGSLKYVSSRVLFDDFKDSKEATMRAEPWLTFSEYAWERGWVSRVNEIVQKIENAFSFERLPRQSQRESK